MADAKIEIAEVQTLLQSKLTEIDNLNAQLQVKSTITWDSPYYWLGSKEDGNGPYCQNCYDDKSKLIRLQGKENGYWKCMSCNSAYEDSTYVQPSINISSRRRSSRWDNW